MAAALATSWIFGGATARAQVTSEPSAVVFPDPEKFAHGLYTEGEFGGLKFLGRAGDELGLGFAVGARIGYDLTRFISVGADALNKKHQSQGDTPIAGQLLQMYQGTLEAKLTLRWVQWSLFAEGGFGAARMSTNLLYARGLARYRTGLTTGGGGGLDYHFLSRHFSVGLRGAYYVLGDVTASQNVTTTIYLRYTF